MIREMAKTRGFTMLEIILVVVLLLSAMGFAVIYYQTAQIRADVNAEAANLTSYLRLLQGNASSGNSTDFNGIHLEDDHYVFFSGTSYSPSDPVNETVDIPGNLTIDNISLNGGDPNIVFHSPDGSTTDHGTFDLVSAGDEKTITITITKYGTISY